MQRNKYHRQLSNSIVNSRVAYYLRLLIGWRVLLFILPFLVSFTGGLHSQLHAINPSVSSERPIDHYSATGEDLSRSSVTEEIGDERVALRQSVEKGSWDSYHELPQIAELIAKHFSAHRNGNQTANWLLKQILKSEVPPQISTESLFPSDVTLINHTCENSSSSDLSKYVNVQMCVVGVNSYNEIVIREFIHAHSTTNISCKDCLNQYIRRSQNFTLDSIFSILKSIDYNSVGLIQKQTWYHIFPTPFEYSGFLRSDGPLIMVGYRPPWGGTKGTEQKQDFPIGEIRLYFPDKG